MGPEHSIAADGDGPRTHPGRLQISDERKRAEDLSRHLLASLHLSHSLSVEMLLIGSAILETALLRKEQSFLGIFLWLGQCCRASGAMLSRGGSVSCGFQCQLCAKEEVTFKGCMTVPQVGLTADPAPSLSFPYGTASGSKMDRAALPGATTVTEHRTN